MKALILSPYAQNIVSTLEKYGDEYVIMDSDICTEVIVDNGFEILISFGYRKKVHKSIIDALKGNAINLHISYLPYNKGTHPNIWSNADGTLSGVTIHQMDEGIDTGNILFQKEVPINPNEHTLTSSYNLLIKEIERLFDLNWCYLRTGECSGWKQQGGGTIHYARELESIRSCLTSGWDTTIIDFKRNIKLMAEDKRH